MEALSTSLVFYDSGNHKFSVALMLPLMLGWTSFQTNSRVVSDLRCHDAQYNEIGGDMMVTKIIRYTFEDTSGWPHSG